MTARIDDLDEILFRQVHPQFVSGGRPASDRFRPQPKDFGKMSVDRGSLTTADEAYRLFTSNGRASGGVFGIKIEEFTEEEILCYSDPLDAEGDSSANPAHAIADFVPVPEDKWKLISKRLAIKATQRGMLFP